MKEKSHRKLRNIFSFYGHLEAFPRIKRGKKRILKKKKMPISGTVKCKALDFLNCTDKRCGKWKKGYLKKK